MDEKIDHAARKQLASLIRQFATGSITGEQLENAFPTANEAALRDIHFYGVWPLYDDLVGHKPDGHMTLTPEGNALVARIILFLHSDLPYRYPLLTGFTQIPAIVLSTVTFGWFGRIWRRHRWRKGDETVWPFYSRNDYESALSRPIFLNGTSHQSQDLL